MKTMSEFTDSLNLGPRTIDEARHHALPGWNIRCNHCGDYGASWIHDLRTGRGALALCPLHKGLLLNEQERHQKAMDDLTQVNFEQVRDPMADRLAS